jgi:hypothetical protein
MAGPAFTLDELVTTIGVDEWKKSIYDLLASVGVSTTTWQPWAPTRALIHVIAIVLFAFSTLVSQIARGGYVGLASRPWLILIAKYRYGIDDIPQKTFATCTLSLVNSGTGVFNPGPGQWIFENPTTGAQYTNNATFSLGVGGTATVAVTCTRQGAVGSSPVGTITKIVTSASGVSVTNTTPAIGLEDATVEEIAALIVARRDSRSTNGPRGAYDYDARTAKRVDGSPIGVNRVRVYAPGDGTVNVYVATASGPVTGDQNTPSSDLGRIRLAILEGAETQGVQPNVFTATAVDFQVIYEVWVYSDIDLTGFDVGTTAAEKIQARIFQRLSEFTARTPIGGFDADDTNKIFEDAIQVVIGQVSNSIYRVKINTPQISFNVGAGQFPQLSIATGSINFVPRTVYA